MPYIINKIMHKTKPVRIKAPMTIYIYINYLRLTITVNIIPNNYLIHL